MKYAMIINRWLKGYAGKEVIEIKATSLEELNTIFGDMKFYNNLAKYEPLDFVKVYELRER